MTQELHIIGGGMAGSEAAWQAAKLGVNVVIHEMRPNVETFAHRTGNLAEMVCSNSFRSDDDEQNAVGLLHWEMRAADGLIMSTADKHRLPAGGALAVDRDPFSEDVTATLKAYLNCPMTRDQYEAFIDALLAADKTEFHEGETAGYFDGCLPIEVMAERGRETLRHGPMKPVGLTNAHKPEEKAHAVVQLRRDNALGTLYNIVGFQTKMKYGAQTEVFRMIPGLENASFARLGGIHRNTFLNSPTLLDAQMRLKSRPNIRFAGQITGVEGYVESAAMGLLAGRMAAAEILGQALPDVPQDSAMGALIHHITGGAEAKTFQPMNVNFGLFRPVDGLKGGRRGRKDRYKAYTDRAKSAWNDWLSAGPRKAA